MPAIVERSAYPIYRDRRERVLDGGKRAGADGLVDHRRLPSWVPEVVSWRW
ncbi:hypothetical protein ACFQ1S_29375 [Kibdelosporangium lantanae]|uniref:Uncharacterized protein n=1 Tax=Kibdelosporangium lantanae TaxID=1497396 RepID=A0ABW3MFA0_9PSEU